MSVPTWILIGTLHSAVDVDEGEAGAVEEEVVVVEVEVE